MGKTRKKELDRTQAAVSLARTPASTFKTSRRTTVVICIFLAGVVWLVFGQTLGHGFLNYDDPNYVYQNPNITEGLRSASIAWAFTHVHSENWHPITTLSHMLDCQLYGLKAGGHHFTNVLLHTIAVLLLFVLLRQMTGKLWQSAFVAAVFAIHPLRVESVAWVAERKDLLSGVFFMLTLILYIAYVRRPSFARYVAMSILFGCGLMSKPMLVTTPLVLLLLDFWPLGRIRGPAFAKATARQAEVRGQNQLRALVVEKIPLFVMSIVSCAATLLAQRQSLGSAEQLAIVWRIQNAIVSYVIYLGQLFWPAHLAPFYPHPQNSVSLFLIIGSAALFIGITAFAFALRQRHPYLLAGWLWYAVMVVPVIGIVQVGWQARADRYTYLPQIGLYLALTWAIVELSASWRHRRKILAVVAVGIIAALAWRAWIQTSYWKDNETLWMHTLRVTEDNDVAQNNLGTMLFQRGLIDEALSRFQIATNLRSGNAAAQDNLARALRRKGRIGEAIVHSRKALELEPNKIETRDMLGTMLFQQGQVDAAISQWREVLARQPDSYAQNNLAWVLATFPDSSVRDGAEAVALAKQALEQSGSNTPTLLRTLAAAYAESGRFSDAIQTAQGGFRLATAKGDSQLADEFEKDIVLYRNGLPLRASRPGSGDSGQ